MEGVRQGLHRDRVRIALDWAELRLAAGAAGQAERARQVADRLRPALTDHPLAEALHARFLLALHYAGDTAAALAHENTIRQRLLDELGTEPGTVLAVAVREIRGGPPPAGNGPAPHRAPAPAQLPAAPAGFAGRERELAELTGLLDPAAGTPGIVLVTGTGGVGKTSLATVWAHQIADRFPDGQLYANLRGYASTDPAPPVEVLAGFLTTLGVAPAEVPFDQDAAAGLYRSLLSGRRLLVLLDNAATAGQVRPLLPATPGSLAIITGRDRMSDLVVGEGARGLRLTSLPGKDAVTVLAGVLGTDRVAAEPAAATELAGLCGGLPLALHIAAANLAAEPAHGIAGYVSTLRAGSPLRDLRSGAAAVAGTFELSYRRLADPARRLFRLLGLHPGPDLTPPAAAALTGTGTATAKRLLAALAAAHLVEPRTRDRYTLHDLLRSYAVERVRAEEPDPDRRAARRRLGEHYLRAVDRACRLAAPALGRLPLPPAGTGGAEPAGTGPQLSTEAAALGWLDAERTNLVALATGAAEAGEPELAWLLADALRGYFQIRPYHVDWQQVAGAAVAAADRHGDERARAAAQLSLGYLYRVRKDPAAALAAFERAVRHAERAGWRLGKATVLTQLGRVHAALERPADAEHSLLAAIDLAHDEADPALEGTAHGNLGYLYERVGDLRRAVPHLRRELELIRLAGSKYREVNAIADTGLVLAQLGQLAEAAAQHRRGIELAREIGDRFLEANGHVNLATVELERGRLESATEHGERALALAEERQLVEVRAEAHSLLAAVGERLGDPARAGEHHRRALAAGRACGDPRSLTEVVTRFAEYTRSVGDARDALELSRRYGYRVFEARALGALAQARLAAGEPDPAAEAAGQSLALCRRTGHRPGDARALVTLGRLARRRDDTGQARAYWRSALELYTGLGMPADQPRDLLAGR